MKKFYVASKTRHAKYWQQLRANGANIISTWIDTASRYQDGDRAGYDERELAERCAREIMQCDVLVLFVDEGDVLHAALIEAGIALGLGKEVRSVDSGGRNGIFDFHPQWQRYRMVAEALKP